MPKRPNPRTLRAARNYSITEAAAALGVSVGTVRSWVRKGLRLLNSQRPYLLLGSDLRAFLEAHRARSRATLGPDQLYCLTCKAPRRPLGRMVDWHRQTAKTGRLVGLCEVCGGTCNRMVGLAAVDQLHELFDVAMKDVSRA